MVGCMGVLAPEKSKEIRIEMERESESVRLYMLTGCRVDSKTGDLYVVVMLYNTPALTRYKYRVVRKFPRSAYEPLMTAFRERMKDEPSLRGILASNKREYCMWQGYFCTLIGGQVLTELIDDLRQSGVEKIDWIVYGKGGRLTSAYLDRFFDLDYSYTTADGIGAGSSRRHYRYYSYAEETFAKNQMDGIESSLLMLSKQFDVDICLGAYTGSDPCDRSLPYDAAEVVVANKERAVELKSKVSAVCKDENLGVWSAGKENR